MNKTKKELIRDLDDLMRIIAFYIDEDIIINGKEEILKKIKKQKALNDKLRILLYIVSTSFLCGASFLLGMCK